MPSPHKKSFAAEQLARQKQKKNPTTIAIIVLALFIVIVAVGYVLYVQLGMKETPTEAIAPSVKEIASIAVLPFVDNSPDRDQEWFCDGLAEAILNALTNASKLRVIARNSAFAFKGEYRDIRAIGDSLDVESVLEGSVMKSGSRIRVTAQLIKVSDNSHLFSRQFDYDIKDVFTLQDSLSLAIVHALKVELLEKEKTAIEKRYTNNPEAWQLYLLGENSKAISPEQRLDYYKKAIELDPEFALAYVRIAWTYYLMAIVQELTWIEAQQKTLPMLEKALALDENLAEAHDLSAVLKTTVYDWDTAEQEYKKAIELNPGSAEAHLGYASFLGYMKRCDEALAEIKRAQKLNPLYMSSYGSAMRIEIILGRYDDALEEFNRGRAIDPNNGYIYQHLGRLYRKQGRYEDAIEAFKKQYELQGITSPNFNLGYTYALKGERENAEHILDGLLQRKKEGYGLSPHIALLYIALGDYDSPAARARLR